MPDVSIDTQKAVRWTQDVILEIQATKQTLDEVSQACEIPEIDPITGMVVRTGEMLKDTYTKTTSAFEKAWKELEDGVKNFSGVIDRIGEDFDNLAHQIGK